jgi:hypothetical protein
VLHSAQPRIKVEEQFHTFLTLAIDKCVISFMAQQLYSREKSSQYPMDTGLDG